MIYQGSETPPASMNKSTLLIAALIIAAVIYLTSCTTQRTPPQPDTAAQITALLEAQGNKYRTTIDSLTEVAAKATARANWLAAEAEAKRTAPNTATASAPATSSAPAAATTTATICPTSYTPQRGALAGQPQTVHTGSRGGCYYFNASGNKTYLPK